MILNANSLFIGICINEKDSLDRFGHHVFYCDENRKLKKKRVNKNISISIDNFNLFDKQFGKIQITMQSIFVHIDPKFIVLSH